MAAGVCRGQRGADRVSLRGSRTMWQLPACSRASACVDATKPHSTKVATEGCVACHQGSTTSPRSAPAMPISTVTGAPTAASARRSRGCTAHAGPSNRGLCARCRRNADRLCVGQLSPISSPTGDGDGTISEDEAVFPNRYATWTPRLLQAAYNYQVVAKDGGAWVHKPRLRAATAP